MADDLKGKVLTRRGVLKALAGGAVGAAAQSHRGALLAAEGAHCHTAIVPTVGVANAAPSFFDSDQMRLLSAIAETLIPTDEHSPGAVAAGVPAYIDTVLSTSTSVQQDMWKNGLAAMDHMAKAEFAATFADCTPSQQEQLLLKLSANEDHPTTAEEKFFVEAKHLTIDGYYNSEAGLDKDLQYVGNEALSEFEGCTHPEHGAPVAEKQ